MCSEKWVEARSGRSWWGWQEAPRVYTAAPQWHSSRQTPKQMRPLEETTWSSPAQGSFFSISSFWSRGRGLMCQMVQLGKCGFLSFAVTSCVTLDQAPFLTLCQSHQLRSEDWTRELLGLWVTTQRRGERKEGEKPSSRWLYHDHMCDIWQSCS
jgi:hypothetical protein